MDEALLLLDEIEENVNICCAITMDPDEVQEMIDKLRSILENIK
jgi:hypothetical protein|tara:strand:- start:293 stop:424 length:132 start_codon:yes stop_codon:yes gene_type:complete